MAALDRIIQLQGQGIPDQEILKQLREEGISLQEIRDAFNQASVKNAVSTPVQDSPDEYTTNDNSMVPDSQSQENYMQPPLSPQPPENYMQPPMSSQPPLQEYSPPEQNPGENYYAQTPQAYSGQDYYPDNQSLNSDTIAEIAGQVVSEKLEVFKSQTRDLIQFKSVIQEKVEDLNQRLRKIESSIDKLQNAVIGKIGEVTEGNRMIHKDLDNLHGTVSKLMDPLIDNYKELKKLTKS